MRRSGEHHAQDLNYYPVPWTGYAPSHDRPYAVPAPPGALTVETDRLCAAQFFRNLRTALDASVEQVAAVLLTSRETILALENADASQLPPWPETTRVVVSYTGLANLDPRPVLSALHQIIDAEHAQPRWIEEYTSQPQQAEWYAEAAPIRQIAYHEPVPPRATRKSGGQAAPKNGRRRQTVFYAVTLPAAALIVLLTTSLLQAAVASLPAPVARAMMQAKEFVVVNFSSERGGYRWIEVNDPRSRRTDKLQTRPR